MTTLPSSKSFPTPTEALNEHFELGASSFTQPVRILLLDENGVRSVRIRRKLGHGGFNVLELSDASRAFEASATFKPDLLLLDADLMEADGYQLCQAWRHHPVTQNIPVLIMIGIGNSRAVDQAYQADATDFICKPLDWPLLPHHIRYLLRTSQLANALRESEKRYSLVLRAANDGLWDWDMGNGAVFYSPRWRNILGLGDEASDPTPACWLERIHPQQRDQVEEQITRHLKGHTSHFLSEYQIRHERGHYLWVVSRGIAERDEQHRAIRFTGSMSNINASKLAEQQLQYQACYDDLTGLPNRRFLLEKAQDMLIRSQNGGRHCALLYLDLYHFKTIKSTLGWEFSNRFLKEVAQRLSTCIPAGAQVGRYERDEFVVLLPNVTDTQQALQHAQIIVDAMHQPYVIDGTRVHSGASLGLALGPEGYVDAGLMVRDADTAVSLAKKRGGNCCEVFTQTMYGEARAKLDIEAAIQEGLVDEQFVPFYQPIVSLAEQRLIGFEALVRWQQPGKGILSPDRFINEAEGSGQIIAIGESVLLRACQQTRQWLNLLPDLDIITHVNLSGRQFVEPALFERVIDITDSAGLPARHLGLEITETALIANPQLAGDILHRLRGEDIHLAIDDFGAGYSSLSYLQQFPFNVLKIDRSFTSAIVHDLKTADIVQAVIKLAHKLDLKVIAEGIETAQEAELLSAWHCDFGQGYFYAPALPEGEAASWLEGKNSIRWLLTA